MGEDLQILKRRTPLLDYLRQHNWIGHPASRSEFVGLCPLHEESRPSFYVNTRKDVLYCHGCGRGGDPAKLKAEIEKKYVTPKGVFQFAESIVTAMNRASPRPIQGVDLSRVTRIMPVLITRDDIGDGFFVNSYLNTRFQDAKGELNLSKAIGPVYCAQLICMSVDVIEKLTPYLIDTRFLGILADRFGQKQSAVLGNPRSP